MLQSDLHMTKANFSKVCKPRTKQGSFKLSSSEEVVGIGGVVQKSGLHYTAMLCGNDNLWLQGFNLHTC